MAFRSQLVKAALGRRTVIRAEFEDLRIAAFTAAQDATNGVLLNRRGQRAGIDPWRLFIGPELFAYAYASEELLRWWEHNPRPVFERYEEQRADEEAHDELDRLVSIITRARELLDGSDLGAEITPVLEILEEL